MAKPKLLINDTNFKSKRDHILYETLFTILEECDSENYGAIDILENIRQIIKHTFSQLDDLADQEFDDCN